MNILVCELNKYLSDEKLLTEKTELCILFSPPSHECVDRNQEHHQGRHLDQVVGVSSEMNAPWEVTAGLFTIALTQINGLGVRPVPVARFLDVVLAVQNILRDFIFDRGHAVTVVLVNLGVPVVVISSIVAIITSVVVVTTPVVVVALDITVSLFEHLQELVGFFVASSSLKDEIISPLPFSFALLVSLVGPAGFDLIWGRGVGAVPWLSVIS